MAEKIKIIANDRNGIVFCLKFLWPEAYIRNESGVLELDDEWNDCCSLLWP